MAKAVFCIARSEAQAVAIVERLRRQVFPITISRSCALTKPARRILRTNSTPKRQKARPQVPAQEACWEEPLGWLVGIGALAIPGLGPFIAAGPIMAALSGAAAGAALGGLTGALIGLGIPEYEAKRYEGKIKEGNVLISVHTENSTERDRARNIFEEAGAEDISYTEEARV